MKFVWFYLFRVNVIFPYTELLNQRRIKRKPVRISFFSKMTILNSVKSNIEYCLILYFNILKKRYYDKYHYQMNISSIFLRKKSGTIITREVSSILNCNVKLQYFFSRKIVYQGLVIEDLREWSETFLSRASNTHFWGKAIIAT